MEGDAGRLRVGAVFSSYDDFVSTVKTMENKSFVQFYKRSSRTVEAARKRLVRVKDYNPNIKFAEVTLNCIHGGKNFKSMSKGRRPNTSTFRKGCPAVIKASATDDGQHLIIREAIFNHNHEISEIAYKHLPRQRRLSPQEREKAVAMLKLNSNKKLVQDQMIKDTKKVITLKDMHNLAAADRDDCDMKMLLEKVTEVPGAIMEFFLGENMVKGIFFQTQEMRQSFEVFPEFLLLDSTDQLKNLKVPLLLMMAGDGNGESEIVALWIVESEDRKMIQSMMRFFKQHNPGWRRVQAVVADKDLVERDVILQEMPDASLFICPFRTLRIFRREISVDAMGITLTQRNSCLKMVRNLVYAQSEAHYQELYSLFKDSSPKPVVEYFDREWHYIRHQWVEGLKMVMFNIQSSTSNCVRSLNKKLKSVSMKNGDITQFFIHLLSILGSLNVEKEHRVLNAYQKCSTKMLPDISPERKFAELLTPYAFQFVKQQLEKSHDVRVHGPDADGQFTVKSEAGQLKPTAVSCSCSFTRAMGLPCRHVFAVRIKTRTPAFDAALCNRRWTKSFYLSSNRVSLDCESPAVECKRSPSQKQCTSKVLSQPEKYQKAVEITSKLASLLSEVPNNKFTEVLTSVSSISDIIAKGGRFIITEVTTEDTTTATVGPATSSTTPVKSTTSPCQHPSNDPLRPPECNIKTTLGDESEETPEEKPEMTSTETSEDSCDSTPVTRTKPTSPVSRKRQSVWLETPDGAGGAKACKRTFSDAWI